MTNTRPKYDLVIIGLGLVGSTAALLAAQLKLRIAIVEARQLSDLPVSKAGRLDAEVYRIFTQMGLQKSVDPILHPLKGTQIIDSKGQLLFELSHQQFRNTAPIYGFYQPELQQLLLQKIQQDYATYIDIYSAQKAEAIEQMPKHVKIHLHSQETEEFSQIQSRFLLVCNGRDSMAPAQLGLPYRYFGNSYYSLNVDTSTYQALEQPKFAQTICDAELPVTKIIDQPQHQRWEFRLKQEQIKAINTPKKIRTMLESLLDIDFKVLNTYVHRFEVKLLDQWQRKRIFITGDAAHVLPPYLGLSLSAGIKDVYHLVWKIALVANHQVTDHILDYYQGEREPNIRHLLQLNLWVERLFQTQWFRWIRHLKPIIPSFILKKQLRISSKIRYGLVGSKHPSRGEFFIQASIQNSKGQVCALDEWLDGRRMVLMAFGENPVDAVFVQHIEYLAKIQTHFIQIIPQKEQFQSQPRYSDVIYDEEGQLEAWFQKNKVQFVLLRADRIIFDAAKNERQLKILLKLLQRKMPAR